VRRALTHEWQLVGLVDVPEQRIEESVGSSTIVGIDDWLVNRKEPRDVVFAIGEPSVG
jgi:hypothetical protein